MHNSRDNGNYLSKTSFIELDTWEFNLRQEYYFDIFLSNMNHCSIIENELHLFGGSAPKRSQHKLFEIGLVWKCKHI